MKIRTNLYLITAILLSSNLLTLCEGDSDVDHELFSDHIDHLDHLDDLHDIVGPISNIQDSMTQFQMNGLHPGSLGNQIQNNNFNNDKIIHSVELVQHNGNSMTKYATQFHTNQETNNELFPNTIPTIQQSNAPATFTKVVKKTVIRQSNNDGNNSPETDLSINDIYSDNKFKENGISDSMSKSQTLSQIDHVKNLGFPPKPSQQAPDLQGNIKNIIHTTVTKTTTSGSPSNELSESFKRIHSLDALPSNHVMSSMSSTSSNNNDGITGLGSLQSTLLEGNSKIKTISTAGDIIDGNGFNNSKRISHTPGGLNRHTKTTMEQIKQQGINENNVHNVLDRSTIEFNTENTSLNNIESPMTAPLGYNQITSTTIDRDNSNNKAVFNKEIPTRRQQTRFNKFNVIRNAVSETGTTQNPGSFAQTKTTILRNKNAAGDIKLNDLNDNNIDYNINKGMSTSNNILSSNHIISSKKNDHDSDSGYSHGYSNAYDDNQHNYNSNYNDNKMSFNNLDDMSGGYSKYMSTNGYSNANGMEKKRKKNSSMDNGGWSKNTSYGNRKGSGKKRIQKGRNSKIRSSKKRNGRNSQYYSSNNSARGQSKSFSFSDNNLDESNMKKEKKQCQCNMERKLNKRDSSESSECSHSKEHYRRAGNHYLGNSMDNQLMENNGDLISALPPPYMGREPPPSSMGREPPPSSMGREPSPPPRMGYEPPPPPSNPLFDMIQGQRPDQSPNYSRSDLTTFFNRQGETRSQQINDNQFPNTDVLNQHLTYQTSSTGSLHNPDFQQEQYFGPSGSGLSPGLSPGPGPGPGPGPRPVLGPQTNSFDSRPFYRGDYRKYLEQNLQPPLPPQLQSPYSFNQDYYSDFSKTDLTTPEFMDIQSGKDNLININTELPQMEQNSDNEDTRLDRMSAANIGSMTKHTRSKMVRNSNGGPIIENIKRIKTTENIDGSSTLDNHDM